MNFTLNADGQLEVSGESEQADAINEWLEKNPLWLKSLRPN
jgi:hypothetical protein